jgi:hypothetical protein
MNVTLYWYFRDGKVREHVFPPEDPADAPFIILTLRDVGRGITTASAVTYIKNKPVSEEEFSSSMYDSTHQFRLEVEKYIKNNLKSQRGITEWLSNEARKKKVVKSKIKRKTGGKK